MKMKKFIDKIRDSISEIFQLILIIFFFYLPKILNASSNISLLITNNGLDFDNIRFYYINLAGNLGLGLVLVWLYLLKIRNINEKKTLNKGNLYHCHSYIWFNLCSKILGYKKCNLILVPIYMQFNLIINDTFEEYPLDDSFFPIENSDKISVDVKKASCDIKHENSNEINLILEDTHEVLFQKLPINKQYFKTIRISRNNKNLTRQYNDLYVEKIISEVRNLPDDAVVNIFATTNPKHTYQIAKRAFSIGKRGNISKIFVFQQDKDNEWKFTKKYKIIN